MKRYYVEFSYKGKRVCGGYASAEDSVKAEIMAGFALVAHYPNVRFDAVTVTEAE